MSQGTLRRLSVWLAFALPAAALCVAPAAASARTGSGALSPRLAELSEPALRSAPEEAQARALGVAPQGPGSLLRRGNRVLVYVRFERGAVAGAKALRAVGAQIVDVSRRYQTITVAAKPAELPRIAGVARVAGVTEVRAPVAAASTCPSGKVISEGVEQLNAGEGTGEARAEFPVDGSGVTVGILSDSFDQATEAADGSGPVETHAKEDVESGDLPGVGNTCLGETTPVLVLEKELLAGEAADEGRAMTQIVHDIAPRANLDFASAFNGETSFAENIGKLATAGAKVIADDVFYFEEPFFQDGPVAVAADEAVEKKGVTYLSAAGNDNTIAEGHDIASWETVTYRDAGSCPPEVQNLPGSNATHCLDFDPGALVDRTFGIKVAPGAVLTVDLQWDEPWNGVSTDLDAFLLDANGRLIEVAAEDNIAPGNQKPLEILQWQNASGSQQTVQLVINRFAGSGARLKFGLLENGFGVTGTEYPRSAGEDVVGPTIFGHSGTAKAISVGAVPFNDSSEPEEYSSRGPVRHDFGPVKGTEAAAPLGSPEELSKPDVVATDCGLTTFFAFLTSEGWRFCGTSAAAPHAGGVAALMLDEKPLAGPAEVRAALLESATPVGAFDACAVGAGLVEAVGAIEHLLNPAGLTEPECEAPGEEVPVEEARAPGNWGSEAPPSPPPPSGQTTTPPNTEPVPLPIPNTFFRQRPAKLVRTHTRTAKVVFRFGSDETGIFFACRIDGGLFRPCGERLVRRFGLGAHSLRVVALNAAGAEDLTPAVFRFRVEPVSG